VLYVSWPYILTSNGSIAEPFPMGGQMGAWHQSLSVQNPGLEAEPGKDLEAMYAGPVKRIYKAGRVLAEGLFPPVEIEKYRR
jgi:hypothetical protein